MKKTVNVVAIVVALSVTSVFAADWPGIYGPRRDHTSEQKGLLRTWPQEGPKLLWSVPMGAGFGGPAVSGGNVYLLDRDEKVGDTLGTTLIASRASSVPPSADQDGRSAGTRLGRRTLGTRPFRR